MGCGAGLADFGMSIVPVNDSNSRLIQPVGNGFEVVYPASNST
jgi:hypothetical protein